MSEEQQARFVIEATEAVAYMHYVVRDRLTNQPVAYSSRWADAQESAKRFVCVPPYDWTQEGKDK